jgi:UDP-glucose 4-epimerase
MNNEKILVTGSSGYIGKSLVKKLLSLNYSVTGISRSPSGIIHENFIEISKNIDNALSLEFYDIVFHMAGIGYSYKDLPAGEVESLDYNILNCVLKAIVTPHKTTFFYPSSASVYYIQNSDPIKEDSLLNPSNEYGLSKLKSENRVKKFSEEYNMNYIIGRIFNTYGGLNDRLSLLEKFKNCIITGESMPYFPNMVRDFIHINDVALAAIFLVNKERGVFNIGTGVATKLSDLVLVLERQFEKNLIFSKVVKNNSYSVANINKLITSGFLPNVNIITWIENTISKVRS